MSTATLNGEPALVVDAVWKRFTRHGAGAPTIKRMVLEPRGAWRRESFWALQDVNLRVSAGETLGLIGANGSGKSTLLRLIGGLGRPTRGRIDRRRAIGAMMTLGESFDPLLTGRENALTAGILTGYTRRQAQAKLDEVVAFSELDEFFDLPIRMYSSGMQMRLAFSVAISTDPEVLLIDEVLSVGDLRFQEKCLVRLEELKERGTTIVLATHDESQINDLCDRVVWLSHGRTQAFGAPAEVYDAYRQAMEVETGRRTATAPAVPLHARDDLRMDENRFGTLEVEIADVRVEPGRVHRSGSDRAVPVRVEIDLTPRTPVDEPIVSVSLRRVADGSMALDLSTAGDGVRLGRLDRPVTLTLLLERLDVEPGAYRFDVGVYERDWTYVYDYHWQAYPIELVGSGGGTFGPPRRWAVEGG